MKNDVKSNQKSDQLREEGNEFYARKRFFDAMVKYNESLCHAEIDSKNLGLGFANRSAVYFEMKAYKKCLTNIKLARENNYPEMNLEVLKKREDKCFEAMKQQKDQTAAQNFFKLSQPENKKLPFVADCLELKSDKKFGRHIVTNRPLKTGDVLAIEEPFCKIVQEDFVYQKCSWCFRENLLDLIPCRKCRKAMFCSSECSQEAQKSFHFFECPLMEIIFSLLSSTMLMALRTFFVALTLFEGSVENLEKLLDENQKSCTIFDVNFSDNKMRLLAIDSLVFDENINVNDAVFEEIFIVSNLKEIWSKHSKFITIFLRKQTQIATMNYHEIYSWPLKKDPTSIDDGPLAYKRQVVPCGNGSYPFCSLLNHHCAPNVTKTFENDKIILIAQRPIGKGEQIFDNYGFGFTSVPKDQRQIELSNQYKFTCTCEACKHNWPMLPGLKISDKALLNKAKKACRELSLENSNPKKAKGKFVEFCELLDKNKNNFPSLEYCSLMESTVAYLEMMSKPPVRI